MNATVEARRDAEQSVQYKGYFISGPREGYVGTWRINSMYSTRSIGEYRTLSEAKEMVDYLVRNTPKKDSSVRKDYITESGGKFTVHAESGKPMGTYPTKAAAEKRLREIEYFKHHDSARKDAPEDADVERLQKQLEAQEKKREGLNRDSQEYADITKHMDRIHREMERLRNFKTDRAARADAGDVRIVYNKLLGGWYVVRGPHQTPLSGRFNSKEEAQASLKARRSDATEGEISERIKREYNRGHPEKQAQAIAYSELGEPSQDAATAEIMDALRAISAGCDRLDARLDAIAARSNGSR